MWASCWSQKVQVYPRVCGGTACGGSGVALLAGLSPRVRGNQCRPAHTGQNPGSIPACAGEPHGSPARVRKWRVYPRVCGGTGCFQPGDGGVVGLSPRVRGNPSRSGGTYRSSRSIPACAGEPRTGRRPRANQKVYPRVCGGTRISHIFRYSPHGLSPRVRGNPVLSHIEGIPGRSIPACAGEPPPLPPPPPYTPVYPRVCGGTCSAAGEWRPLPGLSPRVRGNPSSGGAGGIGGGSIPACAGEPMKSCLRWNLCRVYPRVCGGTYDALRNTLAGKGLSPRVRGNLYRLLPGADGVRSIPACAGEPIRRQWWTRWRRVYPRVCGGTWRGPDSRIPLSGLSPRVRGNHCFFRQWRSGGRSIPACAGEPYGVGSRG